ncbi:class-III pyridoxal-phosphate-dependent aminotransferase [Acidihalobacter aeolianus]|uniref:class-III pyridoxal-phosphate-dependent aminotransferase n=1 Tax=Acidihalobacter aeolianus TaxID=2792603 RepID=UPI0009F442BC|nr:aminotransferase class III-fold pyridoxal phosphate-dependent enzyme [Acidihalobacter aeolianus]
MLETGLAASVAQLGQASERSTRKQDTLDKSIRFWNPGKTRFWQSVGIDLVIGKREGYCLYDMDGKRLIDMHLNGGTYNLGHRNPELVQTLIDSLQEYDIGNHHFPSIARAELAEQLASLAPAGLEHAIYASGGGEAIDVALKSARYATRRRKIVSLEKCYHGHTGLAVATGDPRFSELFLSNGAAGEFVKVPFNDLDAMVRALAGDDVAAVIIETIPATYGFPLPEPGYLQGVRELCTRHGAMYVADEVQTGLGRTGELWCVDTYGVTPDILVTAKGLGGGLYPIGAVLVNDAAAGWMEQDGFGHISTFGGSELGCRVASKVLEISTRPGVVENVRAMSAYFAAKLAILREESDGFLAEVRQQGLVMGLRFAHPQGAVFVSNALYAHGVWAIFSGLDPSVLQFKPGMLIDQGLADEVLEALRLSLRQARAAAGV